MAKKSELIEPNHAPIKEERQDRAEVENALLRLQEIAEKLPPVDVVAVIRQGRDIGGNRQR